MASACDAMVVVGGSHSANSRHLYEICRSACANVQFIENAAQLDKSAFVHVDTVGLTAGASVPAWIIKEVKQKMSDEILTQENPTETENFDEMLEASLKPIYNGEKVTGTVVAISGTEISVDIGTKYSGFIPTSEFTDDGIKVEDVLHVGDTIEASVVRVNDVEGTAMLSKKRLDAVKNWAAIEEAQESGEIVEGKVTEDNKGGIVVSVKGIRVFVPASQSGLPKDAAMSELVGQTVRLKITEVNRGRKRVVGSIRAVAQKERRERAEKIWSEIEVGKHYHGVVKSLTSYGAFVDIGGIDGMVHVSELSWSRIKQPSDVLSVGDEVDVYVISFDPENHKISLGYKDPNGNPWNKFMSTFQVGDVAKVTIVKLMPFGAFAEVLPGVDGLIHISQIANRRIGKPDEVLTVGDIVDAKITAIDEEKHKISLSIRALTAPEPAPVRERSALSGGWGPERGSFCRMLRKLTLWSTKCPPPARPPATSPRSTTTRSTSNFRPETSLHEPCRDVFCCPHLAPVCISDYNEAIEFWIIVRYSRKERSHGTVRKDQSEARRQTVLHDGRSGGRFFQADGPRQADDGGRRCAGARALAAGDAKLRRCG